MHTQLTSVICDFKEGGWIVRHRLDIGPGVRGPGVVVVVAFRQHEVAEERPGMAKFSLDCYLY